MPKPKKSKREAPVEIRLLQLEHALASTPEERKRIRDINRSAIDLSAARFRGGPIASLIDRGRIGGEELQAAQDIDKAFSALSMGLGFKPLSFEHRSPSTNPQTPLAVMDAIERYQSFARYWSDRALNGDKSFEVLIGAVVDERSFTSIEDDIGIRNGMAGKIVVRLLRDYAARAKWVTGSLAEQWKLDAQSSFRFRPLAGLGLAIAKMRTVKETEVA